MSAGMSEKMEAEGLYPVDESRFFCRARLINGKIQLTIGECSDAIVALSQDDCITYFLQFGAHSGDD